MNQPAYELLEDRSYAVVDVETTGLDAACERIVEIGVVVLDADLKPELEWSSLVNPERPVSASHIHGIYDSDLAGAPTFPEIAPKLTSLLNGRIFVAHNAPFDQAFINREFVRARLYHTIYGENTVCTMDQSRIYLSPGSHSLINLAARLGIAEHQDHRSLSDARICADLLRYYVHQENTAQRFTDSAINRHGKHVYPAQWLSATSMSFKA